MTAHFCFAFCASIFDLPLQMHDIVRDLMRQRVGDDDAMREKQRAVVRSFVSAYSAQDWFASDPLAWQSPRVAKLAVPKAMRPFQNFAAMSQRFFTVFGETFFTE